MEDQIPTPLQKYCSEQMNYANDKMLEECRGVDKTLLTLSAGAIVLSITLCTSIKGGIGYRVLLGASWVLLISCILFDFLSIYLRNLMHVKFHRICQMEYEKAGDIKEHQALNQNEEYKKCRKKFTEIATRSNFYGIIAIVLLVIGIPLLAIFAFFNICYH